MRESLSDHDVARLHARFVVPIVVDQMLRDQEPLDDIAEHAMHEILFDLCPDTALLCLSLCARHIARATENLPISKALEAQATQLVEEYGPIWLTNEVNPGGLSTHAVKELLSYIPEDLEALRDLLEATMVALEEDHCIAAILCDILSLQADHHRDIAEIELQNLNLRPQSRSEAEKIRSYRDLGDNIIAFPLAARRQISPQ